MLWDRPTIRAGTYAWALIGLIALAAAGPTAPGRLEILVVPLLLALFPSVLAGPTARLRRVLPSAGAVAAVLAGFLALLSGTVACCSACWGRSSLCRWSAAPRARWATCAPAYPDEWRGDWGARREWPRARAGSHGHRPTEEPQ